MRPANGILLMHTHRACTHGVGGKAASIQKSRSLRNFLHGLLLTILFTAPSASFGQGYFGTVSGEITDPSGAVVAHGVVTLIDQRKGFQFTATSDSRGRYVFTSIPPGLYSVSAELPGFEKVVSTNIQLNVSENATANLKLKVATAKQVVEVQSRQTLDTEDAVTGQVVDRKFINDLPLVDRYVLDLTELAPGVNDRVTRTPSVTRERTSSPMAAAGQARTF